MMVLPVQVGAWLLVIVPLGTTINAASCRHCCGSSMSPETLASAVRSLGRRRCPSEHVQLLLLHLHDLVLAIHLDDQRH